MQRSNLMKSLSFAALLPLAVSLGACGHTDRIVKASTTPDDYRVRHPIVVGDAPTTLDVFPSQGQQHLDSHTAKQIIAFAQQYRDTGHGSILVLVPRGYGAHRAFIGDIRTALSMGGAQAPVQVSTYPVADPKLASPVRLSYRSVKARVADTCGQWPSDLGSGSSIDGWQNKSYWNFGCATQQMIAAQTSDPRDLVAPRGEEQTDVLIRTHKIEQLRQGADPAVEWKVKNSNIAAVGGN